jgi:hypothetical protein
MICSISPTKTSNVLPLSPGHSSLSKLDEFAGSDDTFPANINTQSNEAFSCAESIVQQELDAVMANVNSGRLNTQADMPSPSLVRHGEPTAEHPHMMSGDALTTTSKPPAKQARPTGTSPIKS